MGFNNKETFFGCAKVFYSLFFAILQHFLPLTFIQVFYSFVSSYKMADRQFRIFRWVAISMSIPNEDFENWRTFSIKDE